jgi:dynein heavy chain, axonemal
MESAIQMGAPVLMEGVGEALDAALEPVLLKQTFKSAGVLMVKLGDSSVEWSPHFRLYMTTKLRNPHYSPELCTKVALLNFMTTPEGLQDQLLGIVVAQERPDLEKQKNQLIVQARASPRTVAACCCLQATQATHFTSWHGRLDVVPADLHAWRLTHRSQRLVELKSVSVTVQGAENKRKLKEIEDQILHVLSTSQGNILEDEAAVNVLQDAKAISDDIQRKQKAAEKTEAAIDEARTSYAPLAGAALAPALRCVTCGFVHGHKDCPLPHRPAEAA